MHRLRQQHEVLHVAAIEAAPILRPIPDLSSVLRREPGTSLLQILGEIFESVEGWLPSAKSVRVCSFCYEDLDDDFDEQCLIPNYKFDYSEMSIHLEKLNVRHFLFA